jgi:hypothetical protein
MSLTARCRRVWFETVLVALAAAATMSASQGGAPAPAGAGQPRPAAELATATVSALQIAESIEQLIDRIDRNRLGDQSSRFEATSTARSALGRAQEGVALFGRPIGAPGDPIRRSATAVRNAFSTLSMQLNEAIRLWDKLAAASDENETSDVVRALTSILSDERAWQVLHQGTRDVTAALVEKDRLLLTRAERDAVLAGLKKSFPRLGTASRGGGNAYAAAAVLHEFLTRPLAAADEP